MTDVAREKFMRLMQEVEDLEQRAEELQRELTACRGAQGSPDEQGTQRELDALNERLEQKRAELTRVSNGCRRPHSNV